MKNIKVVAFDLGGVLVKENDYQLTETEEILEKQFGKINTNDEYFSWATSELGAPFSEIEDIVARIIENIYELREPDIFERLPKIKLAVASNHLSLMNNWFDKTGLRSKFDYILISGDVGLEKPDRKFYEKLIEGLKESPEDILFIDDRKENIDGASIAGLSTLLYDDRSKNLTNEILNYLKSEIGRAHV